MCTVCHQVSIVGLRPENNNHIPLLYRSIYIIFCCTWNKNVQQLIRESVISTSLQTDAHYNVYLCILQHVHSSLQHVHSSFPYATFLCICYDWGTLLIHLNFVPMSKVIYLHITAYMCHDTHMNHFFSSISPYFSYFALRGGERGERLLVVVSKVIFTLVGHSLSVVCPTIQFKQQTHCSTLKDKEQSSLLRTTNPFPAQIYSRPLTDIVSLLNTYIQ